jgi:hypothetical protein
MEESFIALPCGDGMGVSAGGNPVQLRESHPSADFREMPWSSGPWLLNHLADESG